MNSLWYLIASCLYLLLTKIIAVSLIRPSYRMSLPLAILTIMLSQWVAVHGDDITAPNSQLAEPSAKCWVVKDYWPIKSCKQEHQASICSRGRMVEGSIEQEVCAILTIHIHCSALVNDVEISTLKWHTSIQILIQHSSNFSQVMGHGPQRVFGG